MPILLILLSLLLAIAAPCYAQDTPLRVGDPIEIKIGGVPAADAGMINSMYSVDTDGCINLPHIGRIQAAGMTAAKLSEVIQQTYISAGIFTNPTIAIGQQSGERFVTVGGEVKSNKRVAYSVDLTILSVIQAAGGFTEYANQKKVVLIRSNGKRLMIDVTIILADPKQDIHVKPGDTVMVPSLPW